MPRLRSEALVTDREPIIAVAADDTIIEVFEWMSEDAIAAASTNPAPRALWEELDAASTYIAIGDVAEAARLLSEFAPLPGVAMAGR